MAPDSVWEIVFLMVILKIPIVYLCFVVWYAIRAKPDRADAAAVHARVDPDDSGPGWGRRPRPRRSGPARPHGGPIRGYVRTRRALPAPAGRVRSR